MIFSTSLVPTWNTERKGILSGVKMKASTATDDKDIVSNCLVVKKKTTTAGHFSHKVSKFSEELF